MKSFRQFLIEEYRFSLLLEGKGQKQVIAQFGPQILNQLETDHGRLGLYQYVTDRSGAEHRETAGTRHYATLHSEPRHGTTDHMHDYIMQHMRIPPEGASESPLSYLNTNDPKDAQTRDQHLNWILSRYARGDLPLETIHYAVLPGFARYHALVQAGKMKAESLRKWKNWPDMESALQNADPLEISGKVKPSEYTVHDENEHWRLISPRTANAACVMGHRTHWCTTTKYRFKAYRNQGPLYMMIPKKSKDPHEKYQFQLETSEFRDKDNQSVNSNWHGGRPLTPKMSLLLKLHADRSGSQADGLNQKERNWIIGRHPVFAIQSPDISLATAATERSSFGRHLSAAFKSPHESIARRALDHPDFGNDPDHISAAFESEHESIAQAAIKHPKFGSHPEHITSALDSEYESIAQAAIEHPTFGSHRHHLFHAIRSPYEFVQQAAIEHPDFGNNPDDITGALESEYESIAQAGFNHRNFGSHPDHMPAALDNPWTEEAASKHPSF